MKRPPSTRPLWEDCCDQCRLVGRTWGLGDVDLGTVTRESAGYVSHYTVKKMTSGDDMRLRGRHPEFARMSLKPGIGSDAMWDVASKLLASLDPAADVPAALRSYGKLHPIGRYLRRRLRLLVGHDEKTPEYVIDQIKEELRPLREAAFNNSSSFAQAVVDEGTQRLVNVTARNAIYKRERPL